MFAPKLQGAVINLRGKFGPTVLGTDNVMMAAVLAEGTTVIEGAAAEPEVCDLADFLNKMGAKIEGAGTRRLIIEGVKELHGAEHDIIPDRIETGTFLVAGAICGKGVTVKRAEPKHVDCGDERADRGRLSTSRTTKNSITVSPNGASKPLEIATEPYPGFPDRHAGADVRAAFDHGGHQRRHGEYFPAALHAPRGAEADGRAGARSKARPRRSRAWRNLLGAPVMASDLRASAALVLAGLKAEGVTEISRVYHIDRGYEHLDEKLGALGAHIERVKAD